MRDLAKNVLGEGRVHKVESLSVTIPAGVDTGNQLRLSGKGAAGEMEAPPGDLYVLFMLNLTIFLNEMVIIYIVKYQLALQWQH